MSETRSLGGMDVVVVTGTAPYERWTMSISPLILRLQLVHSVHGIAFTN